MSFPAHPKLGALGKVRSLHFQSGRSLLVASISSQQVRTIQNSSQGTNFLRRPFVSLQSAYLMLNIPLDVQTVNTEPEDSGDKE